MIALLIFGIYLANGGGISQRMYEKSKKLRQPSNHNPNHCYMDECFSSFR
ncbi:hypothetical protein H1P_1830023 [Hyella patelloides LEGE 07179]|uniref:Uncharacterized protein n=1 Tax=Hyella patelloides LEGE 07179 TaxID=945734 RepID=A0A563VP61_9CYAN|nr:hypothetical protein H1P_1830023 [Hyella patelloides LEGE 07179]